ncbi:hypothetical protein KY359_02270 [Candidatus Woesearchaeota archaeon]|nr:hypothetical protein [Candidatus Woesearchaeota archaeon]
MLSKRNRTWILIALTIILLTLYSSLACAQETPEDSLPDSLPEAEQNTTELQDNSTDQLPEQQELPQHDTETAETDQTLPQEGVNRNDAEGYEDLFYVLDLVSVTPSAVNTGDVLLNLKIRNTGTAAAKNVIPVVVGKGFSSYDLVPIRSIEPGKEATAKVAGRFETEGDILLSIKIDEQTFYSMMTVSTPSKGKTAEEVAEEKQTLDASLGVLSTQLDDITSKYDLLEQDLRKKKSRYDTSEVNLAELKKYIMSAKGTLLTEEVDKTNVSIALAMNEYDDQKEKLDNAPKKSLVMKLKDNALIISAIAGAVVTSITLFELLRKKQQGIYEKIRKSR